FRRRRARRQDVRRRGATHASTHRRRGPGRMTRGRDEVYCDLRGGAHARAATRDRPGHPGRLATAVTSHGGPHGPWTHPVGQPSGARLHYVRQGRGFPVVLLHGWPGFWYEWAPVIPALAEHHDVIAPDLRGFAYSDKPDLPAEEGFSRPAVAEDIVALAAELCRRRLAVVAP